MMKNKTILKENMKRFGTKNLNEDITIPIGSKQYTIGFTRNGTLWISDGTKKKVYQLEAKGFDLTVYKLIKQGAKYIMGVSVAFGMKKKEDILDTSTFNDIAVGFQSGNRFFEIEGPNTTIKFTQIA